MKKFSYTPSDSKKESRVIFTATVNDAKKFFQGTLSSYNAAIYIIDDALPEKYIKIVREITEKNPLSIVRIRAGKKTISKLVAIWDTMVRTVPDVAIVIGGGAVCDLAGVACANYQRGIPRILFPTTILAQVDASIGGKTGIDFAGVKNSVGAIHYPLLTINYMPFLNTLPRKEYISGFSEIIKAAVLYDRKFFEKLSSIPASNFMEINKEVEDVLFIASSIKANICEDKEGGKIRLLYGHAIGHAIESAKGSHLRHGDCVAIGMHLEGSLACMMGIWNKEEWRAQYMLMRKIGLPIELPSKINIKEIVSKMLLYKKLVNKDEYLFVLPKSIGAVNNQEKNYLTPIPKKEMHTMLKKAVLWSKENVDV